VIGAERERRKGEGPRRLPAGVRTFAIVGLLGGVAALLGNPVLLVALAVVVGALAVLGYYFGERIDPGFTTEIAGLDLLPRRARGSRAEGRARGGAVGGDDPRVPHAPA
jgi:hypothetical protein